MVQKILLSELIAVKSKSSNARNVWMLIVFLSRILELFAESKVLLRLGVSIPELAQNALNQVISIL